MLDTAFKWSVCIFYVACAFGLCYVIREVCKTAKRAYEMALTQSERHGEHLIEVAKALQSLSDDIKATDFRISKCGDYIRLEMLSPLPGRPTINTVRSVLLSEKALKDLSDTLAIYDTNQTIN